MLFSDVVGLSEVKETLIQAYKNDHVAHAQMFIGRDGNAALPLALAYATFLNCTNKQGNDACGKCPSCKRFEKLAHPDLHFVFPTAVSEYIKKKDDRKLSKREDFMSVSLLKEWREFASLNRYPSARDWSNFLQTENKQMNIPVAESRHIIRTLSLKSYEGGYKTLVIWLPELMHTAAANAILKVLEEPPEKTLFLLVSHNPDLLLTTILSRCQLVRIRPYTDEELSEHLMSRGYSEERALQSAGLAQGNLSEALRIAEDLHDDNETLFREWMRLCFTRDYKELLQKAEEFSNMSKESQKSLFLFALSIFREALLINFGGEQLVLYASEEECFARKFARVINRRNLEPLISSVNDAYFHIERNASAKIIFFDLSLSFSSLLRTGNKSKAAAGGGKAS